MHDVRDFAGRGIKPPHNFGFHAFLQRGVNLLSLWPPAQEDGQNLDFVSGDAGEFALGSNSLVIVFAEDARREAVWAFGMADDQVHPL